MSLHGKFVVYYGIDTSIWRRLRGRGTVVVACSRIRACGLDGFVLDYASQADRRASADLAARFGFGWYMAPDPRLDRLA